MVFILHPSRGEKKEKQIKINAVANIQCFNNSAFQASNQWSWFNEVSPGLWCLHLHLCASAQGCFRDTLVRIPQGNGNKLTLSFLAPKFVDALGQLMHLCIAAGNLRNHLLARKKCYHQHSLFFHQFIVWTHHTPGRHQNEKGPWWLSGKLSVIESIFLADIQIKRPLSSNFNRCCLSKDTK